MEKKRIWGWVAGAFLLGLVFGMVGHWFFMDFLPKREAIEMARRHEEELKRMHHKGVITAVSDNGLTIRVERSGAGVSPGETLEVQVDRNSTLQRGMEFLNTPGDPPPIAQYLKEGMGVDLLIKDGRAVAIHFDDPGQSPEKK